MYLYSAGVVHRGLSLGNIILLDGYARFSDLEYSLRLDNEKDVHTRRKAVVSILALWTYVRLFTPFPIGNPGLHGYRGQESRVPVPPLQDLRDLHN